MKTPLWIVGSPRSGTTWLQKMLHRHPDIFLTNESRVMAYVSRCLHDVPTSRAPKPVLEHSELWLSMIRDRLRSSVLDFYEELGAREHEYWGDKYPHYADPTADPECLDTIFDMFPDSRFIHIIRDGRAVVASEVERWGSNHVESAGRWVQTVQHTQRFGRKHPENYIEVRHMACVEKPVSTMKNLLNWMRLNENAYDWDWFARSHRRKVSGATSPVLGDESWRLRLRLNVVKEIEKIMGQTLGALGFSV